MKFKIGDEVRVKKLSEEEFNEIYGISHKMTKSYKNYLKQYTRDYFYKNFIILDKTIHGTFIISSNDWDDAMFPEELEKINILSNKIRVIKKLLNKV